MKSATKEVTIEMLIGLPGSGKTSTGMSMVHNDRTSALVSVDDYRDNWEYRGRSDESIIERVVATKAGQYAVERFVIDGLFLTNDKLISGIEGAINGLSRYLKGLRIKLILHYWNEDRETCLKNDLGRREMPSTSAIKNATYEAVDFDIINSDVGEYAAKYGATLIPVTRCIPHTVVLKPDWERFFKAHTYYDRDKKLRSEKWCTGGERGNCWDDSKTPVYCDEPEEFTALDELLEKICPSITFLHYKKILKRCVSTEESTEGEYYGGWTQYLNWVCDLRELYNMLEEFGYITESEEE